PRQIRYLRNKPEINGSVYFSSKSVTNNLGGFQDSLRADLYKYPALVPTMEWLDQTPPLPPLKLKHKKNELSWNKPYTVRDGESAYGYVVYRTEENSSLDISNPQNIVKVIFGSEKTNFVD